VKTTAPGCEQGACRGAGAEPVLILALGIRRGPMRRFGEVFKNVDAAAAVGASAQHVPRPILPAWSWLSAYRGRVRARSAFAAVQPWLMHPQPPRSLVEEILIRPVEQVAPW